MPVYDTALTVPERAVKGNVLEVDACIGNDIYTNGCLWKHRYHVPETIRAESKPNR